MLNENSKTGFETFTKIQKVQFFFLRIFQKKKFPNLSLKTVKKSVQKKIDLSQLILRDTPGFWSEFGFGLGVLLSKDRLALTLILTEINQFYFFLFKSSKNFQICRWKPSKSQSKRDQNGEIYRSKPSKKCWFKRYSRVLIWVRVWVRGFIWPNIQEFLEKWQFFDGLLW